MQSATAPSALGRRLHAEFTTMGIVVVEANDSTAHNATNELVEIAAREHAFAAVRVVAESGIITVWVADRLTNKIVVRTLPSVPDVGGEVVALQVIELLRASLLEMSLPNPNASPRPPSPPEVSALLPSLALPSSTPPSRFRVEVMGTMLGGPGGVSPTGHASVGLAYSFSPRWSSHLFVLLPVVPGTARGPEGRAETGIGLAGTTFELTLTPAASSWSIATGVAMAVAMIRTVGTSESSLLERTDIVYTTVPAVVAVVRRHLSGRASIGIQGLGGVSLPRPVIFFGERETAHWGRPLLGGSLIFDFGLD